MLVERTISLAETLDRVLDKGIVIDARLRVALVGIDLLARDACLIVTSIETYVSYVTRPRGLFADGRPTACRFEEEDRPVSRPRPEVVAARTIQAALRAWNAHDTRRYAALLHDEYFGETHAAPAPLRGRQAARWAMQMKLKLFPDLRFEVQDVITAGNDVLVSWVATATRGNDRVRVPGCTIGGLRDGKITHTWCYWDTDDMLAPLRVISGRAGDGPPTVHRLATAP